MKRALFICFVFIAVLQTHAQTIIPERVVAEVDYGNSGPGTPVIRKDSLRYIYSGYRNSVFNYNSDVDGFHYMNFNNSLFVTPDFINVALTPNNIDSGDLLHMYCDSLKSYLFDTSNIAEQAFVQTNTYNADGTISSATLAVNYVTGTFSPHHREIMAYSSGRISRVYDLQYNNGTWDTVRIRTVLYNSAGNMTLDSVAMNQSGLLRTAWRNTYVYNAGGLCISKTELDTNFNGGFDTAYTFNTYYPNGQLATSSLSASNSSNPGTQGLILLTKDSFTYITGVPGYANRYQDYYNHNSGVYLTSYQWVLNSTTPRLRKDSVTLSIYDRSTPSAITAQQSYKFSYNANGNPVLLNIYDLGPGSPILKSFTRWYYEPILSVSNLPLTASLISLSPNPATSTLTLHYSRPLPNTPITISISNTVGQLLLSESFIPKGDKTDIRLGDQIPPGLYAISVCGPDNSALYKGTFVKQ